MSFTICDLRLAICSSAHAKDWPKRRNYRAKRKVEVRLIQDRNSDCAGGKLAEPNQKRKGRRRTNVSKERGKQAFRDGRGRPGRFGGRKKATNHVNQTTFDYPDTLAKLAPEFLKAVPPDFMDGHPLRYRLANDGHFFLYSVGLNCEDDGGKFPTRPKGAQDWQAGPGNAHLLGTDILWPLPD